MRVRVLAFANVREVVGQGSFDLELPDGALADAVWHTLEARHPALAPFARSTRLARNGSLVGGTEPLRDGDEVAVLPPFGGG